MKVDLPINKETKPSCISGSNIYYKRTSKVFQYFGNFRHNSAAPPDFSVVLKVTNHTGLWNDMLAWYSLSATQQIYLYNLEHGLEINRFRLFQTYFLTLSDRQGSWKPREISLTIFLLNYD